MDKGIWVKVRKFEAYKGRGDVKHNSWFRCSNRIAEDPDFYDFSHAEFKAWIYILSLTSQKNSDTIFINFERADRVCRLKRKDVLSAISKLTPDQLLPVDDTPAVRTRDANDTAKGATDRHTDITNKTDITADRGGPDPRAFDFDSLYQKYPRKEGKSQGYRVLTREIKTPADFENISRAIDRYRAHVEATGTEAKFIKHFSTFMNHWKDWLDPNHGSSEDFGGAKDSIDWDYVFGKKGASA
jgi:hypothetical protein